MGIRDLDKCMMRFFDIYHGTVELISGHSHSINLTSKISQKVMVRQKAVPALIIRTNTTHHNNYHMFSCGKIILKLEFVT